jgi:phage protein D
VGEATIQGALKDLDKRINALASAQATTDAQTYESERYVKVVANNTTYAAIHQEERTRVSEDEALAEEITTLGVSIGDTQAALSTEISVRADADSAEALARTTLEAEHAQTRAILVNEQTVRADADTALSQSVTALSTTVNGHTFTISQVTQSLNGVGGYWGVAMVADGAAIGGFRLAGFRNMDGSFSSQFGIMGDLVVTGTISGPKPRGHQHHHGVGPDR